MQAQGTGDPKPNGGRVYQSPRQVHSHHCPDNAAGHCLLRWGSNQCRYCLCSVPGLEKRTPGTASWVLPSLAQEYADEKKAAKEAAERGLPFRSRRRFGLLPAAA